VVNVHDHLDDTLTGEIRELVFEQWPAAERRENLRYAVGDRRQASSAARRTALIAF
jgi:hypothetical protein